MDKDVALVFAEFGAAVHDAQILESALGLLMALVSKYQDAQFSAGPEKALCGSGEEKTLGEIFRAVKKKEYFTPAEEKIIRGAIRTRNKLVHSFMHEKAPQMLAPKGRRSVLSEVLEVRDTLKGATRVVDSLIDKYLAEYGASVESIKAHLEQFWQTDEEAGAQDLH